jgi:hypothetical protein
MASIIQFILIQGIYAGAISTISSIIVKAGESIKKLYSRDNPDVNKIIRDLDIEKRLKIIQSFISSVNPNYESLENVNTMILVKNPENLCLKYIHISIKNIYHLLNEIDYRTQKHQRKWFRSWRKMNINDLLKELELQFKILNDRFDYFVKIYGR